MTNPKNGDAVEKTRIMPEELTPGNPSTDILDEILNLYPGGKQTTLVKTLLNLVSTASKIASKTGEIPSKVGKTLFTSPEQDRMLQEAGASLRDIREVAGLTVKELSQSLRLPDQSLLTAVENGTATLSFELVLRLAALLARHDPLPFIIRYTRTYNPDLWAVLEDWGVGRLPIHIERERQFINIYRSRDSARKLSDEAFQQVLKFTQAAFEMALAFATEREA